MQYWHYGHAVEYLGRERRYHLEGILGSGGMAEVCLAWDALAQREVALKMLRDENLDQETLDRFMKEAGQIATWQHPHILHIYENVQAELLDPGRGSVLFYIVMEYARGGDLQKRLTPGAAYPLSATFALFHQLCEAVQYAHMQGVIHRDLKPLNILFRQSTRGPEEVVLSDFGLAVEISASHHTFAHGGTLAYMAPEQFAGRALPASDIFALGVILYQLCTGRLPFRRSKQDLLRRCAHTLPTPPSQLNSELPPELDKPILRALRELPNERYADAQAFWDAIAHTLTLVAQTFPLSDTTWHGPTWPSTRPKQRFMHIHRTAEQQNSRTAEQQNSRTAEQQNSRTAGPFRPGARRDNGPRSTDAPSDAVLDRAESNPAYSIPALSNPTRRRASRLMAPHPDDLEPIDSRANAFLASENQKQGSRRSARRATTPRLLRHLRKRWLVLLLITIVLLSTLAITGILGIGRVSPGIPQTVVTLIPHTQLEQDIYTISAVTGRPDSSVRQVQARLLTATSPTQNATGPISGTSPARQATGTLTFIDQTDAPVTLGTTTLISNSGVAVRFNGPVTVQPLATTTNIPAFAVNPGAAGNIPAFDIDGSCCSGNVVVKNPQPFIGGLDAHGIQQSDIDALANPLIATQTRSAQASLQEQMRTTERIIPGTLQCQPNVSTNHRSGEAATSLTVNVSVTCNEEIYDYQATQNIATDLLQAKAANDSTLDRTHTSLNGPIALTLLSATEINAAGQIDLHFRARGLWVYRISPNILHQFAARIAGKDQAEARAFLLQQAGVAGVQFGGAGVMPGDPRTIQIVVSTPPGP